MTMKPTNAYIYIYIYTHTHTRIYASYIIYLVQLLHVSAMITAILGEVHYKGYTVGYATTNERYNEQFLSISGCYNEHRCYNERGGILSADVAGACA